MRQATLCYLIRGGKVCLGLKKRGFGLNLWNGFGGKALETETVEEAARRELFEECSVRAVSLKEVARHEFSFVDKSEWNQSVFVFFCDNFKGEPEETEEMRPAWFEFTSLPYPKMWPDDEHWLPRTLDNKKIKGKFNFDSRGRLLNFEVLEVLAFQ